MTACVTHPAAPEFVFELLDDLRETVAAFYLDQIQAHLRQEHGADNTATDGDAHNPAADNLTF